MRTFVSAYPWDLMDEGIEAALDRLRGELGVSGLTLSAACPSVTRVRTRRVEPRIVRSRGGVLFTPAADRYASTRCKPVVSSRVRSADPLTRIAEACAEQHVDLRVALHAVTAGRLAEKYPESACKNAFDDVSRVSLCLHHPDVQALLIDLVADVASRPGVSGVELRDTACAWYEAFDPALSASMPLDDTSRVLLSLCFCESCHQRADEAHVDISPVRRFVRVMLDERWGGATGREELTSLIETSRPFARFMEWRAAERSALLSRLSRQVGGALVVRQAVESLCVEGYPRLRLDGGFQVAWESGGGEERSNTGTSPDGQVAEWAVRFVPQTAECGATLVRRVCDLAAGGVETVTLDDYGAWTEPAMNFVRQAIRFGRRSTTGSR